MPQNAPLALDTLFSLNSMKEKLIAIGLHGTKDLGWINLVESLASAASALPLLRSHLFKVSSPLKAPPPATNSS